MCNLTGKDVLQDLLNAKTDDVVFLNPPDDSCKEDNGVELQKSLRFLHAYDSIQSTLKNGELDKIRKKTIGIVSELNDKL